MAQTSSFDTPTNEGTAIRLLHYVSFISLCVRLIHSFLLSNNDRCCSLYTGIYSRWSLSS